MLSSRGHIGSINPWCWQKKCLSGYALSTILLPTLTFQRIYNKRQIKLHLSAPIINTNHWYWHKLQTVSGPIKRCHSVGQYYTWWHPTINLQSEIIYWPLFCQESKLILPDGICSIKMPIACMRPQWLAVVMANNDTAYILWSFCYKKSHSPWKRHLYLYYELQVLQILVARSGASDLDR